MPPRTYAYVGPPEILRSATAAEAGTVVESLDDLLRWLADVEDRADGAMVAAFVIDLKGRLRLAPRRSEHVACAAGERVLSAGENRLHA